MGLTVGCDDGLKVLGSEVGKMVDSLEGSTVGAQLGSREGL